MKQKLRIATFALATFVAWSAQASDFKVGDRVTSLWPTCQVETDALKVLNQALQGINIDPNDPEMDCSIQEGAQFIDGFGDTGVAHVSSGWIATDLLKR